jgi:hypothetical protein
METPCEEGCGERLLFFRSGSGAVVGDLPGECLRRVGDPGEYISEGGLPEFVGGGARGKGDGCRRVQRAEFLGGNAAVCCSPRSEAGVGAAAVS